MFYYLGLFGTPVTAAGAVFCFIATFVLLKVFADRLPHDQGRAYAVEGALSKGKARGVGLIFVLVYVIAALLFELVNTELVIYLAVVAGAMLTGFFDDASEKPWNEYVKGALDLGLAVVTAVTYLYFNGCTFMIFPSPYIEVTLPYWLAFILIIALVWCAINVTNCTDGVDGLSATLTIITLGSFFLCMEFDGYFIIRNSVVYFMIVLVAYLWYNANPSSMLMGDAGSRAMGMMIAITALGSGYPLLYIPFSLVMILDGGLGLVKVALLRFFKIKILTNVRCPLHDQARKVGGWSNTQVVFRFAVIQLAVSLPFLYMFRM
ncbi:MAG: phospho-N-acetylmuramoyl-pentapeptide-transferase [Lachnospiraceae bacterium]|nr:phospho-N-acetylmuramoyl-pentapeptide-transferase [Lachnospiraceae bacterium]